MNKIHEYRWKNKNINPGSNAKTAAFLTSAALINFSQSGDVPLQIKGKIFHIINKFFCIIRGKLNNLFAGSVEIYVIHKQSIPRNQNRILKVLRHTSIAPKDTVYQLQNSVAWRWTGLSTIVIFVQPEQKTNGRETSRFNKFNQKTWATLNTKDVSNQAYKSSYSYGKFWHIRHYNQLKNPVFHLRFIGCVLNKVANLKKVE